MTAAGRASYAIDGDPSSIWGRRPIDRAFSPRTAVDRNYVGTPEAW